jgi:hypothetical protein
MLNKVLTLILVLGVSLPAAADEVQIRPDNPETYVVQKGDTLWDIAGRFLTQPWRWPEIWKVNPQIENPDLIYPGDVVKLTYEGGSPVLTVDRGGGAVRTGDRTVKLSPEIRSYDHEEAIPTIPVEAIRHFLSRPLMVTEAEIDGWPYVVAAQDRRLIAGKGDRVYVRGLSGGEGERFSIYRKGPAYREGGKPDGRIIGYEALHVGDAIIERSGDPATAVIVDAKREILDGDRFVRVEEQTAASNIIPRQPDGRVNGSIVSVVDGLSKIGQYQVVVLDVGRDNGVDVGSVLGVYRTGEFVTDNVTSGKEAGNAFVQYLGAGSGSGEQVRLPEQYAGVVLVFRALDRVSYALVMQSLAPFSLSDTVRNL